MKNYNDVTSIYSLILILKISLWYIISCAEDDRIYLPLTSCEKVKDKGKWCQWSDWRKCDKTTCTRYRERECACPQPKTWTESSYCPTDKPQNDVYINDTLVKHTRHIRGSGGVNQCKIPSIVDNVYRPDCFKLTKKQFSVIKASNPDFKSDAFYCVGFDNKFYQCDLENNTKLQSYGYVENDIGACDDWTEYIHSGLHKLEQQFKRIISADSEIGRKCDFEDDPLYVRCKEHGFYDENSKSDYGRLTSLAYVRENCRFACAIDIHCKAFEFIYGKHCALAYHWDMSVIERSIGSVVEIKPRICDEQTTFTGKYPFLKAMLSLRD